MNVTNAEAIVLAIQIVTALVAVLITALHVRAHRRERTQHKIPR